MASVKLYPGYLARSMSVMYLNVNQNLSKYKFSLYDYLKLSYTIELYLRCHVNVIKEKQLKFLLVRAIHFRILVEKSSFPYKELYTRHNAF